MADDIAVAGTDTTTTDAAATAVAASQAATVDAAAIAAQAATDAAAKTASEAAAAAAKAAVIDYTTVALPKDSPIDPAVLERTVAIARARGLSTEQAQAAVDLVVSEAANHGASLLKDHAVGGKAWTAEVDKWKAETLADTTLGATPEERKAAIDRGGSVIRKFAESNPEHGKALQDFMDSSGIGERRELVHFLSWLGKAAGERQMAQPSDAGVRTQEQVLNEMYPTMKK